MDQTVNFHERQYTVILERSESGSNWGAYSPEVSRCIAVGDTPEQTLDQYKEALEFHIEG